jgi:quercetin dioxygenase-like cupin family protein
VATEEQENVVEPGDFVLVPEGEKHWHGGTETSGMAHISIGQPGGQTTPLEAVDKIKTQV